MLSKRLSAPDFLFVLYRSKGKNAIRILKKPVKCAMYTKTVGKHGQKIQNERTFETPVLRNKIIANVIAHFAFI